MNPTEIDDALGSDRRIEPPAEFGAQVMRAVHARASIGRPRNRLWTVLWPAVAVMSVVAALLIASTAIEQSDARPGEVAELVRWLSVSLTGTLAIAWRSTRRIA